MAARVLPTGTLTFLFSDIEGSTRLVQELGSDGFRELLERHNAMMREAFGRHGGTERGTQGDSFLVMFPEAPRALAAAAEAQRALAATTWPGASAARVRMGLHTGVGTLGGDDYVSVDVNRAARVAGAAHGGQVLVSDATRALCEASLPEGTALRSLGEHRLRDLANPEHLHQLVIDGLPSEFPPPTTLGRATGNLPTRLTSFIGREAELAELATLVAANRLVTLTGPGGTGKTSLAQEVARRIAADFEDGAWFVPLEHLDDPRLVGAFIAARLGLVESAGATAEERLTGFLANRRLLLVLDNFEQVLEAAPVVGDLLAASSGLRVVVTSRAALRLGPEQEFPVRPLSVPGNDSRSRDPDGADAVRLFVDRARRVSPGFEPEPADLEAVAEIVRRLDGLPLGIEIAASRVALLPPREIAERLARRLDLPGPAARDQPERRRTMTGAIAWSHDLLGEPSRHLLARLSVFVGGCALGEAEAVCSPAGDLGIDVLDGIAGLVEQSLVMAAPSSTSARFRLLDTVRMYAAERLAERDETTAVRDRHLAAYLALAEWASPYLPSRQQPEVLRRLRAEHGNFRTAIVRAIETGDASSAMRLVRALWRYWQMEGHLQEGLAAVTDVLAMPGADAPTIERVRFLDAAGGLSYWSNDLETAHRIYDEQIELARAIGDPAELANALYNGSFTARIHHGDWETTIAMQAEAAELFARVGDERGVARLDWTTATNLMTEGRFDEAEGVLLRAYDRFRALDDVYYLSLATDTLAWAALARTGEVEALKWSARSVKSYQMLGDVTGRTIGLAGIAVMLLSVGLAREAAIVRAAYDTLSARYSVRPPILLEALIGPHWTPERLAAALDPDELEAAQRLGAQMTLEEVVDFVIAIVEERFGEVETPLPSPLGD